MKELGWCTALWDVLLEVLLLQPFRSPLNVLPITMQASLLSEEQPTLLLSNPFCHGIFYLTVTHSSSIPLSILLCFPSIVFYIILWYQLLLHWQLSCNNIHDLQFTLLSINKWWWGVASTCKTTHAMLVYIHLWSHLMIVRFSNHSWQRLVPHNVLHSSSII